MTEWLTEWLSKQPISAFWLNKQSIDKFQRCELEPVFVFITYVMTLPKYNLTLFILTFQWHVTIDSVVEFCTAVHTAEH